MLSDQVGLGTCYFGISLDNFHAYSGISLESTASKRTGAIFIFETAQVQLNHFGIMASQALSC